MQYSYRYRPPLKYLLVGLGGIILALIFGAVVGEDPIYMSIIASLFCLLTLALGLTFLNLYFRKVKSGNLVLGPDYIEVPGRWKQPRRIPLSDLSNVVEMDTYDQVLELYTKDEAFLIERNWMKKKSLKS